MVEEPVDARPEKRFFVEMLTRDIELAPAIIDLVDNSIDGAKRLRPNDSDDRFNGLRVDLALKPDLFEIRDTCGGFSRSHALAYAFKFGGQPGHRRAAGEVGQFGVGMKRAIFKIGRDFVVESKTATEHWRVARNVDRWLDDEDDWTFPLVDLVEGELDAAGTLVRCTELLPSASSRLGQAAFVSRVLSEIAMRHAIALQQGLRVTVNDRRLVPRPPALLVSDELKPIAFTETIEATNGSPVELRIYAGLAPADEDDDDVDTDDPTLFTGEERAGWYLFCNGRALLFANRGRLTGWGEELPRFHPQYRRFRGYAYLSGDSAAMPWNTAKTAVDEDSEVWAAAREHMVDALRKSMTVMNRIKREVEQRPKEDRPLVAAVERSRLAPLEELTPRRSYDLPPRTPRVTADVQKISYSVARDVFRKASGALGTTRPSEVGQRTFGYWMRREVDREFDMLREGDGGANQSPETT